MTRTQRANSDQTEPPCTGTVDPPHHADKNLKQPNSFGDLQKGER